ncbi:MAG: hypothetical protein IT453_13680 [Planctomycetes bacterium]|nr:hypothetical protein [Planctomycetota bacterium]
MNRRIHQMLGALVGTIGLATAANAQNLAWVDPWAGCDAFQPLNDPTQPFRTLQAAINACSFGDIVVANPGVYEISAPLQMHYGVSLQGVGARRCVIRQAQDMSTMSVFWPDATTCGQYLDKRVLVDARGWVNAFDFIDGFTFQGGDVQIYAPLEAEGSMTVSNCLFDLATDVKDGPAQIGYLLVSTWLSLYDGTPGTECAGYYPLKRPHILNNTFLFGYTNYSTTGQRLDTTALTDAVGVVDVNDPRCYDTSGTDHDCDPTLRGVNDPNVQNNLFRILPSQGSQVVMLGLDDGDTSAMTTGGASVSTNAFPLTGVGGQSPSPMLFSGIAAGAGVPTPKVDLTPVSGSIANDPAFVGEFLAMKQPATLGSHRDFRLMPGSSMIDQGQEPLNVGGNVFELQAKNGTVYRRLAGPQGIDTDYDSYDWDMEYHGNVRIAGAHVDIGFDEFHSLIACGTYSNDDASHNVTHGPLTAVKHGPSADRWFVIATMFANSTATLSANGANAITNPSAPCPPVAPAKAHDAWTIPVGALAVPFSVALPPGFSTRYINFGAPFGPMPWGGSVSPVINTDVNVQSGLPYQYCLFDKAPFGGPLTVTDVEGTSDQHFVMQAVIRLAGLAHYTNAQCEYR